MLPFPDYGSIDVSHTENNRYLFNKFYFVLQYRTCWMFVKQKKNKKKQIFICRWNLIGFQIEDLCCLWITELRDAIHGPHSILCYFFRFFFIFDLSLISRHFLKKMNHHLHRCLTTIFSNIPYNEIASSMFLES